MGREIKKYTCAYCKLLTPHPIMKKPAKTGRSTLGGNMDRPKFMEKTFSYTFVLSEEAKRILDMILVWAKDTGETPFDLEDTIQFLGNDELIHLVDYGFVALVPYCAGNEKRLKIIVPTCAEQWARWYVIQDEMRKRDEDKQKEEALGKEAEDGNI